ncbi:MAG TPA: ECF-type sigma factor [Vicinamibacteria bacterium]|nr:ECF-type sigma factor [Vicinamibacteria bacterium]
MEASKGRGVTELLHAWKGGSDEALDDLVPIVYGEIHRLARNHLRHERHAHTLQPTALTNEAFVRLFGYREVGWQDRAHFFAVAAQVMRRILVDHARKRRAAKRGAAAARVTLDEAHGGVAPVDVDVLALHEALERLEALDPRQCRIVELRYFGGLSVEETASVLDTSRATVTRDWNVARLWLRRELEGDTRP